MSLEVESIELATGFDQLTRADLTKQTTPSTLVKVPNSCRGASGRPLGQCPIMAKIQLQQLLGFPTCACCFRELFLQYVFILWKDYWLHSKYYKNENRQKEYEIIIVKCVENLASITITSLFYLFSQLVCTLFSIHSIQKAIKCICSIKGRRECIFFFKLFD